MFKTRIAVYAHQRNTGYFEAIEYLSGVQEKYGLAAVRFEVDLKDRLCRIDAEKGVMK